MSMTAAGNVRYHLPFATAGWDIAEIMKPRLRTDRAREARGTHMTRASSKEFLRIDIPFTELAVVGIAEVPVNTRRIILEGNEDQALTGLLFCLQVTRRER